MCSLFVVGNGSIARDENGRHYVTGNTGRFLASMRASGYRVLYADPVVRYARNANLQDYCLEDQGLPFVGVRRSFPAKLWDALRCVVAAMRSDCVYVFLPGSLGRAIALCLALLRRTHFGIYVRGERLGQDFAERLIFRAAKFCVSVTPGIVPKVGTYPEGVHLIRPMISLSASDAQDPSPNFPKGPVPRLLFVGRVAADKGVHELVAASDLLRDSGFDHRLEIVGGGPLLEAIHLQQSAGRHPQIELLGQIDDPYDLFARYLAADVFVLPTHHEGFPRVLYEAMLAGLPTFVTMVGGIGDLMRNGFNCIEIPVASATGLAKILEFHLVENPANLRAIAKNGQLTAFDVLATREAHHELLGKIMNKAGVCPESISTS